MSRKEGVVLNEGDKGQEMVPLTSASGGKEQEGYPGWCEYVCVLRFPDVKPLPQLCLQYNSVKHDLKLGWAV